MSRLSLLKRFFSSNPSICDVFNTWQIPGYLADVVLGFDSLEKNLECDLVFYFLECLRMNAQVRNWEDYNRFQTGAMKLGRDAIVLMQTSESGSMNFLSLSFNDGKSNVEVLIVSYCRRGSAMELDTSVQSEAYANYHLAAIKEFFPFDEYFIGEKLGFFRGKATGTQIYI
ncbi:hypothetical protein GIB67_036567 [Kingdonia uniflora]|uniref:Uncharacterized protein n=1 Tax=Kingdonia uniflora TaxID=39325 RepID=A0A7J7NC30_9MAGN|nr:hypothetical protein GIB67_005876 [Kingdonia uniflora]KAF6164707.1 hypothetical protein GIB67_036567 [Kingdonia uniflora]